jgi:hypothetical protein
MRDVYAPLRGGLERPAGLFCAQQRPYREDLERTLQETVEEKSALEMEMRG